MKTLLFLLAALSLASPAMAQPAPATKATSPSAPAAVPAPAPAAPASPAPSQAKAALEVLKDDVQRAKLINVLEGIVKASPAAPAATAPAAAPPAATQDAAAAAAATAPPAAAVDKPIIPLPLKPDSVGADVLVGAAKTLDHLSDELVQMTRKVTDFPLLWNWVTQVVTDPELQLAIGDTSWRLVVVLSLGLLAEWLVSRILRPAMRALAARAPDPDAATDDQGSGTADAEAGETEWQRRRASVVTVLRRLPYCIGRLLLDLLPVLAVIATANVLLGVGLAGRITARLVILSVLEAYVIWRVVVALVDTLVAPRTRRLRLLPLSDSQARIVSHQARRLAAVAIGGYVLAETALLFGLYRIAYDALLKLDALVVYALVVAIVLRNRRGMRDFLRAPPGSTGSFALLRNGLAGAWHRIIIFYLAALWVVWALEIPDGFARLLRVMAVAVAVIVCSRLIMLGLIAALDRALQSSGKLGEKYPGLDSRIAAYHPVARAVANLIVTFGAIIVLLQAWGFGAFEWFNQGALGDRLLGAIGSIIFTLLVALAVWESANIGIQRHLARLTRDAQVTRSARLRTFLPMLQTVLLSAVCIIAGLIVLSEIGINIAPLLAGAGVIGIAIGLGSQKLVQDVITGLFLLLENTMQVGDSVTLGGLSGTVENLSIRTIKLRALDGSVHMIPFSAVTTVTNMTRDFGYAVIDVNVGVNEEPDRVADVLRDIAVQMRKEEAWRPVIMADLEVMGVDRFNLTTWVLRVRIKTLPAHRWAVGRELNRRIKYKFDELAIESPMTSYNALGMATPAPQQETEAPQG